ncbi:hypothetical protein TBLA_0G01730 [Henningerozyma blattae CBS 6284]|uniref:Spindle pole body-associated protein Vik1/Cik1 microtubule binding domain-containing protein n=1 Tax=Henningerozyma blattae (strain ATCC 34711 / CBS 6284 / DSM 70876 / NBRC 10599 / NRRL Y-10934 / UCD 77-7) TaxID=1071380 RepID=I2H6W5_HENB6|nr:hypothetical protein TBLA_0G01730 [Tetrapisispora blattae CBS 6284]CCH62117.1 hypothetical protein TBLA_0G01730 [Tetrapisispora blattae CBS 6284]
MISKIPSINRPNISLSTTHIHSSTSSQDHITKNNNNNTTTTNDNIFYKRQKLNAPNDYFGLIPSNSNGTNVQESNNSSFNITPTYNKSNHSTNILMDNTSILNSKPMINTPSTTILSENVLDIQNSNQSNILKFQKNSTPKQKYLFGDASTIEEVKIGKRNVLRSLSQLKKNIRSLNYDIDSLTKKNQDLEYKICKFKNSINLIDSKNKDYDLKVQNLNEKLVLENENMNIYLSEVKLKLENKLKNINDDLIDKYNDEIKDWELKIKEVKEMKPSKEFLIELEALKETLAEKENELNELKNSNQLKLIDYENKLKEEFELFKLEKSMPLQNLTNESYSLIEQIKQLNEQKSNLLKEIESLDSQISDVNNNIEDKNKKIEDLSNGNIPLKLELEKLEKIFEEKLKESNEIKKEAELSNISYRKSLNNLKLQELKNKILENSIEDLKGTLRCYSYLNEENFVKNYSKICSTITPDFKIDYFYKNIHFQNAKRNNNISTNNNNNNSNNKVFKFSKILSNLKFPSEKELLEKEYAVYHNSNLKKNTNFTLFSISPIKCWDELIKQIIKFVSTNNNYLNANVNEETIEDYYTKKVDYKINLQVIDNLTAQGNLINIDTENNSLKIDETIESIELNNDIQTMPFLNENDSPLPNIQLLTFTYWNKSTDSISSSLPVIFYFVQMNGIQNMNGLYNLLSNNIYDHTSITNTVIKHLLNHTQNCFLLNMQDEIEQADIFQAIMNLSQVIYNSKVSSTC